MTASPNFASLLEDLIQRRHGLILVTGATGFLGAHVLHRLLEDPETSVGFLNLGPRLTLNLADLASTGLVTAGSRVSYRLGVAGAPAVVATFRDQAGALLGPGQRVEDVRDARPEIRSALERAERFLGLSALLSVLLAAVAVALAARRYLRRHLDGVAIMRCPAVALFNEDQTGAPGYAR